MSAPRDVEPGVPDAGAVECPACPVEVRDLAACAFNVGANRNVPHRLPEKLDLLAGAVARFQPFVDRHFAHVDSEHAENRTSPIAPAPASPAGGEVGEAETGVSEAVCWVLSGGTGTFVTEDGSIRRGREHAKRFPTKAAAELARKDIKAIDEAVRAHFQPEQCPAALQAAARVRAASPDGEGWRSIEPTHWRPIPPPPGARPDPAPAAATPPDIIAAARAEERDYLRNEIVSLCEDTEQRYADVAERDTEGKQGAFSRGRIVEAKSIRKAICEVIRIRAADPIPSTDATGGTTMEGGR